MNNKIVLDIIKANLSDLIKEGYKYSFERDGASYKKETNFGYVDFGYRVVNYKPNFIISDFGYSLRLSGIEVICLKFNSKIEGLSYLDEEATIFGGYGGLVNIKYHDFGEMKNIEDVENVSQEIKNIYYKTFYPFLEKHSDINYLENEINKNTERDLPYILYWRGRRSMRGLILAKLCNNPRYEELKIIYRQKCIEQEDADVLEAYDKLAYYLDHEFEKT